MKRHFLYLWKHCRRNLMLVFLALIGLSLLNPFIRQSIFGPTIDGTPWCVWEAQVRQSVHPKDKKSWLLATLEIVGLINPGGRLVFGQLDAELPLYRYLADDEDVEVRRFALQMMFHKKWEDRAGNLLILQAHFRDDDPQCRLIAASGAWRMTKDPLLTSVVLRLIGHADRNVHRNAVDLLCEMAPNDPTLFGPLSALAKDSDRKVRLSIARSMYYFGKRGSALYGHFAEDDDAEVRRYVLRLYMHKTWNGDSDGLPLLRAHLQDDDLECRLVAAQGAWQITKERELKSVVLPLIGNADSEVHRYAVFLLCEMAKNDPTLFDPLAAVAKDSDSRVRDTIVRSLHHFGKRGLPILRQTLHDPDYGVRATAIYQTRYFGKEGLEFIPLLEEYRKDADKNIRQAAASALHGLDPKKYPSPPLWGE